MKLVIHTKILSGLEFTLLDINENNVGSFKFRNVIRKFRIVNFGGAEAAVNIDRTPVF
ncbi:MAG: hypothetical protein J6T74_07145 [Clostridia bacterium]|nr:hypothetical protein [Clostridia bacterium]